MTVRLEALRIAAEVDNTKYLGPMRQIDAANKSAAASSKEVGTAIGSIDTKADKTGASIAKLSRMYVSGFSESEKFNAAIRTLARGMDTGNVSAQRAEQILTGLYQKYKMTADATQLAARGALQLSQVVTTLNPKLAQEAAEATRVAAAMGAMERGHKGAAASATVLGAATGILRGSMLSLTAAIAPLVSIFAVGFLGRKFISETVEAEATQAQLAAALKSTGAVSGQTITSLNAHASALQNLTTFSDDAVGSAQKILLTFTKIGGDVFPQATEAVLDLSTRMGGDLSKAAVQLGKALNDPIRGIASLGRVGVQFDEGQRALIQSLVETNRLAEAQAIILRELQVEFGGSAVAARGTLGGALSALGNAWGELFESTGEGSENMRLGLENLIGTMSDPSTKSAIQTFGGWLFTALSAAAEVLGTFINGVDSLIQAMRALDQKSEESIRQEIAGIEALLKTHAKGSLVLVQPGQRGFGTMNPDEAEAANLADAIARLKVLNDELAKRNMLGMAHNELLGAGASFQQEFNNAISAGTNALGENEQELMDDIAALIQFEKVLAALYADAQQKQFQQLTKDMSELQKHLLDSALKAGLLDQAIRLMNEGNIAGIGALIDQFMRLRSAIYGAADAQSVLNAAGQTKVMVPNSSGGQSEITVIRPGPTATGTPVSTGPKIIDVQSALNGLASGGPVHGPGTGTSDSIPAMLSAGEYVVRADAVKEHRALLDAINAGNIRVGYAEGGAVLSAEKQARLLKMIGSTGMKPGGAGVNVLGTSTEGNVTKTQFSFNQAAKDAGGIGAAAIPRKREDFGDPGIIAFDKAHPNWDREVREFIDQWPKGPGFNRPPEDLMAQWRLVHGDRYHSVNGGGQYEQLDRMAWFLSKGGDPTPDIGEGVAERLEANTNRLWASGGGDPRKNYAMGGFVDMPSFAGGGAIMPGGTDSQVVQFRKSPDEMAAVFTPAQRRAVGDAMGGGVAVNIVQRFNSQPRMADDPRFVTVSRAELRQQTQRAVNEALASRH